MFFYRQLEKKPPSGGKVKKGYNQTLVRKKRKGVVGHGPVLRV